MLLTAAAIRQFCSARKLEQRQMQLFYNDDANYQYACHMGFFQAAEFVEGKAPGEAPGSGTYIPLTKINIKELLSKEIFAGHYIDQGDIIEIESKRLSRILSQNQTEMQKVLQYLIREAVRNIPEHAETNDVWICGQYWHNRDLAEIAILDEGIGIYNSLIKNTDSLEKIERWVKRAKTTCLFSYDAGQMLSAAERYRNTAQRIDQLCLSHIFKLTNKIRTNKELISSDFFGSASYAQDISCAGKSHSEP